MAEVAALKAVDLALATGEPSERSVAVDEFRAREIAGPKTDRNWPRVPERIAPGRVDSGPKLETDTHDPSGSLMPQGESSPIDPIDTDVTPLATRGTAAGAPADGMLPAALCISLGLVLGYAAGYFRGSRETLAAGGTPVATRPAAEPQTPTTGRTAAKETTEQVVTPKSAPAVPLGASPAPATPTTAAPAVKPTTPAAAKPTTAAATPAAKPAPPPRETRPAAATTGRIVITSTPSKAAGGDQRQVDGAHATDGRRLEVRGVRRPRCRARLRGRAGGVHVVAGRRHADDERDAGARPGSGAGA